MDGNKDDAVRCLETAKKEFTEFEKNGKDKDKFYNALRLAEKSERMYPSIEAKGILALINAHEFAKNGEKSKNGAANTSTSNQKIKTNNSHKEKVFENGEIYISQNVI